MKELFISTFDNEFDLKNAAIDYRDQGYKIYDAFTPYAIHGLGSIMGLKPSRLTIVCFIFGFLGLIIALWGQYWISAVNWPINIGGKPWNSLPSFLPVAFEITVLSAGLGVVLTFLVRTGVLPGRKPVIYNKRVTDDLFTLVVFKEGGGFDNELAIKIAERNNALEWDSRMESER